jgi:hypothetical protein
MSWRSRFRQAWRTWTAEGDQAKAAYEQTRATLEGQRVTITVADSRNVMVGDGTVQNNVFGPDPDQDGPEEDPPEDGWDPGPEIDDQGGMSEVNPIADEAGRKEAGYFGDPELGR